MKLYHSKLITSSSHEFPIMISLRENLATFALCVLIVLSCVEASTIRKREAGVEDAHISHNYDASAPSRPFRVRIATYTEEVDALLTPTEGFLISDTTPVWHAYTKDGRVVYEKLNIDILKGSLMFYQDSTNNAAVLVRGGERGPEFIGQFGDLGVLPLPAHDSPAGKEKRSITNDGMVTDTRHVVFRLNEEDKNEANEATRDQLKKIVESASDSRSRRDAYSTDDVVYPSILAVASHKMTSKTFDDKEFYHVLVYQMALWNGVDLRFRKLESPAIRLHMAGFVIATDDAATPYLNACTRTDHCAELDTTTTVYDMQKYWTELSVREHFPLESYHMVITSTPKKFFRFVDEMGWLVSSAVSTGHTMCNTAVGELIRPAAAFSDDGAFSGIRGATFVLATALGAKRDDIEDSECNNNADGYIMSSQDLAGTRGVRWSKCSKRSIQSFLSHAECLKEPEEHKPAGNPLPKILPGHMTTTTKQCLSRGWEWACKVNEQTCESLKCYRSSGIAMMTMRNFGRCQGTGTPADGTPCGFGKECIGGKCENMAHIVRLIDTL